MADHRSPERAPWQGWATHHEWGPERTPAPEREPRLRHATDWFALLGGLLFVGIGVRFIIGPRPDPLTMLAVLLVGLAVAGLVALTVKATRRR